MRKDYLTKVYGNGFSPGANPEAKLKLAAKIILLICLIVLLSQFY